MHLSGQIEEYLLEGLARGWSEATSRQYAWQLQQWSQWLAGRDIDRLDQIDRRVLRAWAAGIRDRWGPASCRVAIVTIKAFFGWAQAEGLVEANPAANLKLPRVPAQAQRTISRLEVLAMLEACDRPVSTGLSQIDAVAAGKRNGAIVALLFDSLLRAGELCRLDLADLDQVLKQVKVRGKGGKTTWVRFGDETTGRLELWTQERARVARSPALFVSLGGNTPGGRLTTSGLRVILRRIGERAGIGGVSPHAFRRGGAVQALANGAPSRLVQLHGRWDDLAMLEVYTRRLEVDALFDRFSPLKVLNGDNR